MKAQRSFDQFALRLPTHLSEQLRHSAEKNLRSINSEIVFHLKEAINADGETTEKGEATAS